MHGAKIKIKDVIFFTRVKTGLGPTHTYVRWVLWLYISSNATGASSTKYVTSWHCMQ